MIDWNDPVARARYIEQVGSEVYNAQLAEHHAKSALCVINGHAIRPQASRFGRLLVVGQTGRAFATMEEASEFASMNPPPLASVP